jgi:Zn-dependent M28 family amino/carboxypeptidase
LIRRLRLLVIAGWCFCCSEKFMRLSRCFAVARASAVGLLLAIATGATSFAQSAGRVGEKIDEAMIAKIKEEGLKRSQVMETIGYLTDVHGPRLTGSPQLKRAAEWTKGKAAEWGLANVHSETWGPFGRGWSLEGFTANIVEPSFGSLIAVPKAWSPSTPVTVRGTPIYLDVSKEEDLEKYRGKLHRAIVLLGAPRDVKPLFEAPARRQNDENLLALANGLSSRRAAATPTPGAAPTVGPLPPGSPGAVPGTPFGGTAEQRAALALQNKKWQLIYEEGAAVVLEPGRGDGGTVFVGSVTLPAKDTGSTASASSPANRGPRPWAADAPDIIPQVVVAVEHYNRIVRMLQKETPVKLEIDIAARYHTDDLMSQNIVAEIPGDDLKDEVVMLGGHFDSWHSGTGATDNAIGCGVALEAVRILKSIDAKPRRTIRLALWTGEEQGLLGSKAYVTDHFGKATTPPTSTGRSGRGGTRTTQATKTNSAEPSASEPKSAEPKVAEATTGSTADPAIAADENKAVVAIPSSPENRPRTKYELKPEHAKFAAYFNLDNGTGKVRGVYLQGNEAVRPIFRAWLAPFADLGASTLAMGNTGGTDHLSFDAVGLPGFQFIQDPLEYDSRTHHSNMDVFDRLQADDVRQASVIMAAFVYLAANRDEKLPRKPLVGEVIEAAQSQ